MRYFRLRVFISSPFQRPKNIQQALKRRLKLTWRDVANHWFIFESFRQLRDADPLLHSRSASRCSQIEDVTDSFREESFRKEHQQELVR